MIKKLLMLSLLLLFNSCSKKSPLYEGQLRIGLNAWPGYEFLYLAKVKNYFSEMGLNVKIIEFTSLSDSRRAFEKEQIEILATNIIEQIISRVQSDKVAQTFHVVDVSDGADVIISDKKFKNLKELKGRKIGVEFGSLTVYELSRALELVGMTLKDVEMVNIDQLESENFLADHKVDAVVTYPPFSISMISKGKYNTVFTSKQIPNELVDVIVADKDFIKNNPETIKAILAAFQKAFDFALNEKSDGIAIMAARENVSPNDFAASIKDGMKVYSVKESQDLYLQNDNLQNLAIKVEKVLIATQQIPAGNFSKDIGVLIK